MSAQPVIPAQAGIQWPLGPRLRGDDTLLGPRLRGDDAGGGMSAATTTLRELQP